MEMQNFNYECARVQISFIDQKYEYINDKFWKSTHNYDCWMCFLLRHPVFFVVLSGKAQWSVSDLMKIGNRVRQKKILKMSMVIKGIYSKDSV